jgi:hypothetical protein
MAKPSVIEDYLTALSAELPASIVEELSDGLDLTRQRYLDQGLEPAAATDAALTEFGDPNVILAEFTRLSPARRAARTLLATGPVVGGCWGIALISGRAWSWPVPVVVRIMLGIALLTIIGSLAAAALGQQYRSVGKACVAGCAGIAAIDVAALVTVPLVTPAVTLPIVLAMAASLARLTMAARGVRLARAEWA